MYGGGNWIYGLHYLIHNGLFAECRVHDSFRGLCGPRTRTCNRRTRTRTCKLVLEDPWGQGIEIGGQRLGLVNWSSRILEDKDFPWGQQQCSYAIYFAPLLLLHHNLLSGLRKTWWDWKCTLKRVYQYYTDLNEGQISLVFISSYIVKWFHQISSHQKVSQGCNLFFWWEVPAQINAIMHLFLY